MLAATIGFFAWVAGASASDAAACRVTKPNGSTPPGESVPSVFHHGEGGLWTGLWPDGKVVFAHNGPGHILPDGSMSMKFWWWRGVEGQLKITGRRLDGEAPQLRASVPHGYGATGFQATAIIFPTEGCWEVTGIAGQASLTFVTLVVREK